MYDERLFKDKPASTGVGVKPIVMTKYIIRFRYIPPFEKNTPLMHLPIEQTGIEAENEALAWSYFLDDVPMHQREWYRCEGIYVLP